MSLISQMHDFGLNKNTMASTQISATIDLELRDKIMQLAKEKGERISFSWMVNHLLTQAVLAEKMKKG